MFCFLPHKMRELFSRKLNAHFLVHFCHDFALFYTRKWTHHRVLLFVVFWSLDVKNSLKMIEPKNIWYCYQFCFKNWVFGCKKVTCYFISFRDFTAFLPINSSNSLLKIQLSLYKVPFCRSAINGTRDNKYDWLGNFLIFLDC